MLRILSYMLVAITLAACNHHSNHHSREGSFYEPVTPAVKAPEKPQQPQLIRLNEYGEPVDSTTYSVVQAPAPAPDPMPAPLPPAPMPAPMVTSPEPVKQWHTAQGENVSEVVKRWALEEGWEVKIYTDKDWKIEFPVPIYGDYTEALRDLISGFPHAIPQPKITNCRGNRVSILYDTDRAEVRCSTQPT